MIIDCQAHFTGNAQLVKASFDRIWFCEESSVGFVVHVAFRSLCGFALTVMGGMGLHVKLQKLKFTNLMHCFLQ